MSFVQPVQCSRAWYDFVSQTAIKDQEVLRLAQDYIAAMNKLNARLAQLAKADPSLKPLTASAASDTSASAVRAVQEFHALHGVSYTADELLADATRNGIQTFNVSA